MSEMKHEVPAQDKYGSEGKRRYGKRQKRITKDACVILYTLAPYEKG